MAHHPITRVTTRAMFIPWLAPIQGGLWFEGIQIKPHPVEGVLLFATDQAIAAEIHDRSGSATGPLVLNLPDALVAACRPLVGPQLIDVNAEPVPYPLPGWTEPGKLIVEWFAERSTAIRPLLSEAPFSHVEVGIGGDLPDDVYPLFGEDGAARYVGRLDDVIAQRAWVDWEQMPTFAHTEAVPTSNVRLQTRYLGLLQPFGEVAGVSLGGPEGAACFSFEDAAAGWSARVWIMPCKAKAPAGDPETDATKEAA